MCFHNGSGNRQPKTGFTPLGPGRVGPVEPVENMWQGLGGDPLTIILYTELPTYSLLPGGQDNSSAFGSVTQGIRDQVAEDLRHPVGVQADLGQTGFTLHFQ